MPRRLFRITLPTCVVLPSLLLFFGCGEESPTTPSGDGPTPGLAAPDFSLPDVNATSPRYDEMVSPRDYLQAVSGWYFGHAT